MSETTHEITLSDGTVATVSEYTPQGCLRDHQMLSYCIKYTKPKTARDRLLEYLDEHNVVSKHHSSMREAYVLDALYAMYKAGAQGGIDAIIHAYSYGRSVNPMEACDLVGNYAKERDSW